MIPVRVSVVLDSERPDAEIDVRAGGITVHIVIADRHAPIPVDEEDKQLMDLVGAALLDAGVTKGMLRGPVGPALLFALAKHVRYTMDAEGDQVELAGLPLARLTPPQLERTLPMVTTVEAPGCAR